MVCSKTGRRTSFALALLICVSCVAPAARAERPQPALRRLAVSDFTIANDPGGALLAWQTADEGRLVGFYVYRSDAAGAEVRVSDALLLAAMRPDGCGRYALVDPAASAKAPGDYVIESVDAWGNRERHGPFRPRAVAVGKAVAPVTERSVPTAASSTVPAAALAALSEGTQLKLLVRDEGLYYLSASNLADRLVDMDVAAVVDAVLATNLALVCQGSVVTWLAAPAGDGLYFYGEGVTDAVFTEDNVYWLTVGPGETIAAWTGPAPAYVAPSQQVFYGVSCWEYNDVARPNLFSSDTDDLYLGEFLYAPASKTATIPLYGVAVGPYPVTVSGRFKEYSNVPGVTDHQTQLLIGTQVLAEANWDGSDYYTLAATFTNSAGLVSTGDNVFTMKAVKRPDVSFSVVFNEDITVTYPRYYRAVSDMLLCDTAGYTNISVSGLSSSNAMVWDVSDRYRPVAWNNAPVSNQVDGSWTMSFAAPVDQTNCLLVATPQAARVPDIAVDSPSSLANPTNRADYVIVTVPHLLVPAQELLAYRASQGLLGRIALIEDVCDEFADGLSVPHAVGDFVSYAVTNWALAPRYFVLAGNGTFDFLDVEGAGDQWIKPMLVLIPEYGMYASDGPSADVDGDGLPDVALGRLPVNSTNAFHNVIDKIMRFEEHEGAWRERVHLAADDPELDAGDFTDSSDQLAAAVAPEFTVEKNYLEYDDISTVRASFLDALNSGCTFVNYIGHASQLGFAGVGQKVLETADVASLTNALTPPIVSVLGCGFVRFGIPGLDMIGETMLVQSGGGSGMWGSVGPCFNDENTLLGAAMFRSVYTDRSIRIGDAIMDAFDEHARTGHQPYHRRIFCYLGDPAMALPPPGYSYAGWLRLHFSEAEIADSSVTGEQADPDHDGVVNLMEFTVNSSPTNGLDASFSTWLDTGDYGDGTNTYVMVAVRERVWQEGITTSLQICDDLMVGWWRSGETIFEPIAWTSVDRLTDLVTRRVRLPLERERPLYIRLRVEGDAN